MYYKITAIVVLISFIGLLGGMALKKNKKLSYSIAGFCFLIIFLACGNYALNNYQYFGYDGADLNMLKNNQAKGLYTGMALQNVPGNAAIISIINNEKFMDEQQGWQYGLSKGGVQGDVEIINAGKNLSATAIMSNPPLSEELFKQLIGNDKYSIIVTNMTPTNDFLDYAKANNIVVAVINVPVSDVLKEAVKNGKLASMVYAEGVVDYS
ncbi:MAG: hypothetical protein RR060_06870, partial [Victivallaceae bacterium]